MVSLSYELIGVSQGVLRISGKYIEGGACTILNIVSSCFLLKMFSIYADFMCILALCFQRELKFASLRKVINS